ncbi:MAG: hypothetical protein AB7F43_12000 [Bacteriovoracia bacterium]
MLYILLFFVRYYPFWALPATIILFELGLYSYNRRDRIPTVLCFGTSFTLVVLAILWILFEGYWRAAPFIKGILIESPYR